MTAQDKAQVAAYKKLKQTGEYAAIYGYSFPGQGKIYLSKPIIKRSQEDVQDFINGFRTGKEATKVVVDVFYQTQLDGIEDALRSRKLIESFKKPLKEDLKLGDKVVISGINDSSPWEGKEGQIIYIEDDESLGDYRTVTVRVQFPTDAGIKEINQNFDYKNVKQI